jgi:transposase
MIKPDFAKWGQSLEEVRQLAITAEHERSRERFQALYMIGCAAKSATEWAREIERQPRTVLGWVHRYNAEGAEGVAYQHSGGHSRLLNETEQAQLVETVRTSTPVVHELPGYG